MNWEKPKPRENKTQPGVITYLESRAWFVQKVESRSANGFPDLFCARGGRVVLIEWKRDGDEEARLQQQLRHRQLRAHGVEVHVIGTMEDAKRVMH